MLTKPNPKGVRRYHGVGFVKQGEGHYRVSHQWRFWDVKRSSKGGWECEGRSFRTMADVAEFIIDQM